MVQDVWGCYRCHRVTRSGEEPLGCRRALRLIDGSEFGRRFRQSYHPAECAWPAGCSNWGFGVGNDLLLRFSQWWSRKLGRRKRPPRWGPWCPGRRFRLDGSDVCVSRGTKWMLFFMALGANERHYALVIPSVYIMNPLYCGHDANFRFCSTGLGPKAICGKYFVYYGSPPPCVDRFCCGMRVPPSISSLFQACWPPCILPLNICSCHLT